VSFIEALRRIGIMFGGMVTLAVIVVGFGLLVWLPAVFAYPHSLTRWASNAENKQYVVNRKGCICGIVLTAPSQKI
jgi:hypothetical protein